MDNPKTVTNFLKLKISHLEHEVFYVLYLDAQHRTIKSEVAFTGTVNGSSVHPREIVKAALKYNACAVIFAHNHPSGITEASSSDRKITKQLIEALELIDVKVLDHIIVGDDSFSFSERGYL